MAESGTKASVVYERDLELRRLQAENRRLREERTVLKKQGLSALDPGALTGLRVLGVDEVARAKG